MLSVLLDHGATRPSGQTPIHCGEGRGKQTEAGVWSYHRKQSSQSGEESCSRAGECSSEDKCESQRYDAQIFTWQNILFLLSTTLSTDILKRVMYDACDCAVIKLLSCYIVHWACTPRRKREQVKAWYWLHLIWLQFTLLIAKKKKNEQRINMGSLNFPKFSTFTSMNPTSFLKTCTTLKCT